MTTLDELFSIFDDWDVWIETGDDFTHWLWQETIDGVTTYYSACIERPGKVEWVFEELKIDKIDAPSFNITVEHQIGGQPIKVKDLPAEQRKDCIRSFLAASDLVFKEKKKSPSPLVDGRFDDL